MIDLSENTQRLEEQKRNAGRIYLVSFGIALIIGVYYSFILYQRNTPLSYGEPNIQAFFIAFASLISYWLLRQRQLLLSVFLFLGVFTIAIVVSALFFGGLDIILALTLLVTYMGVAGATMPRRVAEAAIVFSIFLSVVLGFIGYWNPLHREYLSPDPVAYIFAGFLIIIYGTYLRQQYRHFSLRTKLVISFAILSAASVGIAFTIANINIERVLSENGRQRLLGEAELSADKVDAFLQYSSNAVESASVYLEMRTYLGLSPDERKYSQIERQVQNVLYALKNREPDILSYGILDLNGTVIIDSRTTKIGTNEAHLPHFIEATTNPGSYVSPVLYLPGNDEGVFFISTPIYGEMGLLSGVLRAEYRASVLQDLIATGSQDATELDSFFVLFDENHVALAHERLPELIGKLPALPSDDTLEILKAKNVVSGSLEAGEASFNLPSLENALITLGGSPFFEEYDDILGISLTGATTRMDNAPWVLVAMQSQETFTIPVRQQAQIFFLLAIGTVLFAVVTGSGGASLIAAPVLRLQVIAQRFAEGDLDVHANVESEDEIGHLARTFNILAKRLKETVDSLEERVQVRTRDLELRSHYLEGAAEIGRLATSFINADELSRTVVELIRERFNLYYVGLFLADQNREWAVLKAGTGVAGEIMLSNNHRLKIGEGMIGWTVKYGEARIALDVGEDAVRFENPVLPETRSEGALPLRSHGRVLGAISVQSAEPAAFTFEILTTLQTMADQIAVAFDNAELFARSEAALEAERRAYGELTLRSWHDVKKRSDLLAFHVDADGTVKTLDQAVIEIKHQRLGEKQTLQEEGRAIILPIKSRGYVIGGVRIAKPAKSGKWTKDQLQLVSTISEQLSVALESARLFEDAQLRAQREAIISDISAKVGASIRMDTILKTTVRELGKALSGADISFEITDPEKGAKP